MIEESYLSYKLQAASSKPDNRIKSILIDSNNSNYSNYITISEIPFDLQMFAGEKTEEATEKRKRDAIQEGNVAKSQDLGSVLILLAGFLMLRAYGENMYSRCADFMRYCFSHILYYRFNIDEALILLNQFIVVTLMILLPFMIVIMLAAIFANVIQVGFLFRFDPMTPNFDRMNPVSNIQNMFSWKLVAELVKSFLKIFIVAYVPYSTIKEEFREFIGFIKTNPLPSFGILLDVCYHMAIKIILIFLVLAIADWFFQKWRHDEGLKMSKEDIKEEHKQQEGDPHVKQKIRELQRKASARRQMEEVPKATVVVTNPTHIAVAIKYIPGETPAPLIVAMGTGLIAQKIKEIAKEHDVPIVENKPLAREMFKKASVGDEIPQELWTAVAEILGQIFREKYRKAA
jgi:flagellar biosynthetic protein FlhB